VEVILGESTSESAATTFLTIWDEFTKCGKNYTPLLSFGHIGFALKAKGLRDGSPASVRPKNRRENAEHKSS
jgi:hypothetical protein